MTSDQKLSEVYQWICISILVNHICISFVIFHSFSKFTLKTEIGSGHFPPGSMASIDVEGGKEQTLVVSGSLMLQKFDTIKMIIQDETLGSGSNYDIRQGSTLSAVVIGKFLLFPLTSFVLVFQFIGVFLVIQKQLFPDVLQNRCSQKFCKIQRKTPVSESLFK